MGNIAEGAKAGLLSGIVYGILDSLFGIVYLTIFKNDIISVLKSSIPPGSSISATSLYNLTLSLAVVGGILGGIIIGLILGLIFSAVYGHLPGSSATSKGLVFGLIMWLLFNVLLGLANLRFGILYYGLGVIGGLLSSLIFGAILGKLYDRGMKKLSQRHVTVVN
jgi:hypothetical protein